jgi:acyl-CoA thioester hydrolase
MTQASPQPFSVTFRVGWAQIDANAHMRNTAYLELCVDVHFMYFQEHGFPAREFERLRFGPVIFRDEVDYLRELRMLESVRVTLALAGLSEDGMRFRLRDEFFAPDGKLAARVTITGAWLDLDARKLTVPPEALAAALSAMAHTDDFEILPARSR